mmetsp:Transcript_4469/g.10851  ORF Transcript_4469/g.10851 Transcript_4469/m.10851 type:complete len:233 (+) Transcript_4469:309-1007(+)
MRVLPLTILRNVVPQLLGVKRGPGTPLVLETLMATTVKSYLWSTTTQTCTSSPGRCSGRVKMCHANVSSSKRCISTAPPSGSTTSSETTAATMWTMGRSGKNCQPPTASANCIVLCRTLETNPGHQALSLTSRMQVVLPGSLVSSLPLSRGPRWWTPMAGGSVSSAPTSPSSTAASLAPKDTAGPRTIPLATSRPSPRSTSRGTRSSSSTLHLFSGTSIPSGHTRSSTITQA